MDGAQYNRYRYLQAHRISGSLGAEITGVDLIRPIDHAMLGEIRAALLDHLVIFFRNQAMTPATLLTFARRFGAIHRHPFIAGMPDYPDVLEVAKKPTDNRNFGGDWHTDQMYAPEPAMGTLLWAKEVPEAGGDTMFANQYLAYESLSVGMKRMIAGVRGVCVGDKRKAASPAWRTTPRRSDP